MILRHTMYVDNEGHEVRTFKAGFRQWKKNGKLHRDGDKPAIKSLTKQPREAWYKNGQRHRENNPALVTKSHKEFCLKDATLSEFSYWIRLLLMEY